MIFPFDCLGCVPENPCTDIRGVRFTECPVCRGTTVVVDGLSRLEYDQSINSRTINVHVKNKALVKCLRRYVEVTSDYPDAMQMYDSTVLNYHSA